MKTYIQHLLLTVVCCQTAEYMAGMTALSGDTARRGIRVLCRLVILLTLVSPVSALVQQVDAWFGQAAALFELPAEETVSPTEERLAPAAEMLFRYAERYGLDGKGAELVFLTDEAGEVTEIQLFFPGGDARAAARLTEELQRELDIPVHSFTTGMTGQERMDEG